MNIDELKPGKELDALVAERIFGARLVYSAFGHGVIQCDFPDRKMGEAYTHLPRFSTEIKAAWEVVEKLKLFQNLVNKHSGLFLTQGLDGKWEIFCHNGMAASDRDEMAEGESAPHAICLAALKAVEGN